jgi:hypothetical protein
LELLHELVHAVVRERWAKKWMRIDSDCCNVGAFLGVLVNGNSAELNDCAKFLRVFFFVVVVVYGWSLN